MISVICPFYNEAAIIEASIKRMLANLTTLGKPWELIVVNDGSTDNSFALAHALMADNPNLSVLGYPNNRGRGFAGDGIAAARGNIVVTTEVDCSWGDDIAHRIVKFFDENPNTDMVIASPHLATGGYANVPNNRILVSRLGNVLLRAALSSRITMYTGMQNGYRRDRFLELPWLYEKEFHLDVARKALAFGFTHEVPATLTWQHEKLAKPGAPKRKSSSRVRKLVRTHLLFGAFAAPILATSYRSLARCPILATGFLIAAFYNFIILQPSGYYLFASFFLYLFALVVLLIGILTHQNIATQTEIWRQRDPPVRSQVVDQQLKVSRPSGGTESRETDQGHPHRSARPL